MEREGIPGRGHGCLRCGSEDVEVRRPGLVEGLGDWLRSGGRWRPASQRCRRCGDVSAAGSAGYLVRAPGWWAVPARLAGVVRRRRSRVPVPRTYVLAAAAGAILGAVAQLVLGWPWWLVAAGVVAAVWLGFLSSAFWGGGGDRPLATEALMVVDPRRGLLRALQAMEAQFRAAPLPLYGLAGSWAGPRHLGGYGQRRAARGGSPVVTSMSLAHGDPLAGHGPQLRVEVRAGFEGPQGPAPEPEAELRELLADDLRWSAAITAGQGAGPVPWAAPGGGGGETSWSEVSIPVDGHPVAFAWLAEGRHWVAHAELEGHRTLVLFARDLPADRVALVRVTDVEPYLEGTRRIEQARAREGGRS
jgi:hypothetical protein